MKYLDDVLGLIKLNDVSYTKLGNDKDAFRRVIKYFIIVSYIMSGILAVIAAFLGSLIALSAGKSVLVFLLMAFLGLLVLPWVGLAISLFYIWLHHILALALGGKAKKFSDFYKVYQYPRPLVMAISFIPIVNLLAQFYAIWDFAVLYKVLRNIHKLTKTKAIWFIVIKAVLSLFMVIGFIIGYIAFVIGLSAL
jgi:hypothetical protein